MDYKKMITDYAKAGGSEEKMWDTVEITEMAMDYIKATNPEKYWCLMRKLSESLYGKHYSEEFAHDDVEKIHYLGKDGAEHHGAHWTVEQIETATANKTFPKGTTKWDKYVVYNATYSDLAAKFDDAQILEAAFLLWFDDKDWKSDGKIWDYMGLNR